MYCYRYRGSVGHNLSCAKRLNQSRCHLRCGLKWALGTAYWLGKSSLPQKKGHFGGVHLLAHCKVLRIYGMRSIFSTLFGRWQQRCGLSPSLLQQVFIIVVIILRNFSARKVPVHRIGAYRHRKARFLCGRFFEFGFCFVIVFVSWTHWLNSGLVMTCTNATEMNYYVRFID